MNISVEFTPNPDNNGTVIDFLIQHWGSPIVVSKGKLVDASTISRVIVKNRSGTIIGLTTFLISSGGNSCELVSINAKETRKGIGTKMIKALEQLAKEKGVNRIWMITTNDNYEAAIFYITNGYRLVNVNKDALDISRKLKPQIPRKGKYGIPILDEWEFEKYF